MNQLDVYYRALIDYRAQTLMRRECITQRGAVTKVNTESDHITVKRMICTVDEDWVNAIEAGLIHVEKAIKEERQFIRTNGEVIPIEKVKHVSKDSVVHLAKHSNLITKEIEGEDIIPEHLYTVEKLSDYTVYENRFLYMLLCYLRDFITLRYNKILESSNTYDANMTMQKKIKINKRTISYDVKLEEIRKDDEYLKEHNEAKDIIDRIDLLLKAVLAFLATPLMECASKVAMLKPPITKTNVLKMNKNFKGAMALYEYITTYDKPGYTIETRITDINPFRENMADELAETVLLSSFLTYEYGLNLREMLQNSYDEEEKRRKEEEYQLFLEKLEKVRRRVQKSGQSPEEYILMLEKHIRILEEKCSKLDAALAEIERLKAELSAAYDQIESLKENVETLSQELEFQKNKYIEDIAALKAEHAEQINQLVTKYETEIDQLKEEHSEEIRQLKEEHAEEIRLLNEAHDEEIRQLNDAHAEEIRLLNEAHAAEIEQLNAEISRLLLEIDRINEEHAAEIVSIKENHAEEIADLQAVIAERDEMINAQRLNHIAEKEQLQENFREELKEVNQKHSDKLQKCEEASDNKSKRIEELLAERDKLIKEKRIMSAQLYALRTEKGIKASEDDFTSKENFDELENEFEIFKKFYRNEWKNTKKSIRKNVFKTINESKK